MATALFRAVVIGVAALAMWITAAPAAAQGEDACPTWFPDLRCNREARFEGFSPPMTAPYLFEDPFITTGISLWSLWHDFPDSGAFGGGDLWGVAGQVRVALTDRLGFIATKDGWVKIRPDNPVLPSNMNGFLNLAFGLKYALVVDEDSQFILTPSLRFEAPTGSRTVFSGWGDGIWIPGLGFGKGFGDTHLLGNVGWQIPVDGDDNSSVLFYNLHIDRSFKLPIFEGRGRWVPLVELNGYWYQDAGTGRIPVKLSDGSSVPLRVALAALNQSGFEGLDLLNLGSNGVKGESVLTWGVGLRYMFDSKRSVGLVYERPMTTRRYVLKQRITLNLVWEL